MQSKKQYLDVDRNNFWEMNKKTPDYFKEMIRYHRIREILGLKGRKVLDLGCGDGYFSHLLASDGNKVTAADVSRARLDKFKKIAAEEKIKQVLYDGKRLPFVDRSFDAVVILEVIEHLVNYEVVLKEIFRVLKKDGKIIVGTPYNEALEKRMWQCPHCEKQFHLYGHVHSFDEKSLKEALEKTGFKFLSFDTLVNQKTINAKTKWGYPFGYYAMLADKINGKRFKGQNKFIIVQGIRPVKYPAKGGMPKAFNRVKEI